jgi:hypothetical protein
MMGRMRWMQSRPGGLPPASMTAILEDDGTFTVEGLDPAVCTMFADLLTSSYRETNPGPADGAPGARFLADLAKRHGGTYELAEYEPDPPGTIY